MTIGVAAFVTSDWREQGYPLDLWLLHHAQVMDQISLVTYGEFELPFNHKNIKVTRLHNPPAYNTAKFWLMGKQVAFDSLETDWKVLLDIDEFLAAKPDISGLDKGCIYPLVLHNLWGGIDKEVVRLERFWFYGDYVMIYRVAARAVKVLNDGNAVGPVRYWKLPLALYARTSVQFLTDVMASRVKKVSLPNGPFYALVSMSKVGRPFRAFDVWHTTFLIPLNMLLHKIEIKRKIHEKIGDTYLVSYLDAYISSIKNGEFCTELVHQLGAMVRPVDSAVLPNVLLENRDRFQVCTNP